MVPFGSRKLTGMVVRVHDDPPEQPAREAFRLIDEEPALEPHLIELGRWIAGYYCAPLGEVLRVMAPVAGEVRQSKVYSLTDAGLGVARQLSIGSGEEDPATRLLRLLENRSAFRFLSRSARCRGPAPAQIAREEGPRGDGGCAGERDPDARLCRAPARRLTSAGRPTSSSRRRSANC